MAYGFQNCCDGTEYFYVNGIPSSVSELETYYIDTTEGLDFCATYVELPELFYQPKTYNLVGMTAQTDCTECTTSNPCPDIIEDDIDSISSYITTTSNECAVITESFFEVTCRDPQPIIPTFSYPNGGRVYITVTGGVPPYLVYSANTTTQLAASSSPGNISVLTNKPGGTYSFDVLDFTNNVKSISCTLPVAPTLLTVSCNKVDVSGAYGNTNGQILTPSVAGGTPPYTYWSGSTQITSFPITNLGEGTYTITVKDSGTNSNFQQQNTNCIISQPEPVPYPSNLCMSFEFCGTGFLINFVSAGTLNGKTYYTPNAAGNTSLGITSGMQLYWDNSKWTTTNKTKSLPVSLAGGCSPSNTTVKFDGPTSQQPIGSWSPISSSFYINDGSGVTVINVTEGSCTSSPLSVTAVANNGTCSATPNGTITLTVNNGAGPYIVFIGGVDNNGQLSKTGLNSGTYSWSVTDATNRTASGSVTLTVPIQSNIIMTIAATYNVSPNPDLVSNTSVPGFSGVKLYGRYYNLSISITGLAGGESLQGYFVVTYKQLSLYRTVTGTNDYTSGVYEPGVTFLYPDLNGDTSGNIWSLNGSPISAYQNQTTSNQLGNRVCPQGSPCVIIPVSTNILPSSNNSSCPTTTGQAGVGRISYQVGTTASPLSLSNNSTVTTLLTSGFRFTPNTLGTEGSCQRAYAEDWEIYFVNTGTIPTCKTLTINGTPYNSGSPQNALYRRSFDINYSQATNLTQFSAIVPDNLQRVTYN